jgi:hypothetical protein
MRTSILLLLSLLLLGVAVGGWAEQKTRAPGVGTDAGELASHQAFLKDYRDQLLAEAGKGKLYRGLMYRFSESALKVLDDDPELMCQAKALIEANKEAVSDAVNGDKQVFVYRAEEVLPFLRAYAKKAPFFVKIMTHVLIRKIEKKQKKGELLLVSDRPIQSTR